MPWAPGRYEAPSLGPGRCPVCSLSEDCGAPLGGATEAGMPDWPVPLSLPVLGAPGLLGAASGPPMLSGGRTRVSLPTASPPLEAGAFDASRCDDRGSPAAVLAFGTAADMSTSRSLSRSSRDILVLCECASLADSSNPAAAAEARRGSLSPKRFSPDLSETPAPRSLAAGSLSRSSLADARSSVLAVAKSGLLLRSLDRS